MPPQSTNTQVPTHKKLRTLIHAGNPLFQRYIDCDVTTLTAGDHYAIDAAYDDLARDGLVPPDEPAAPVPAADPVVEPSADVPPLESPSADVTEVPSPDQVPLTQEELKEEKLADEAFDEPLGESDEQAGV